MTWAKHCKHWISHSMLRAGKQHVHRVLSSLTCCLLINGGCCLWKSTQDLLQAQHEKFFLDIWIYRFWNRNIRSNQVKLHYVAILLALTCNGWCESIMQHKQLRMGHSETRYSSTFLVLGDKGYFHLDMKEKNANFITTVMKELNILQKTYILWSPLIGDFFSYNIL